MTVHLRPTALEDILAAGRFYDTQEGGLGDQVVDFLQSRMKELELTGGMPPPSAAVSSRWPFRARFPITSFITHWNWTAFMCER